MSRFFLFFVFSVFFVQPAFATGIVDYPGASDAINAEIPGSVNYALAIAGFVLAVSIGFKIFKRFTR